MTSFGSRASTLPYHQDAAMIAVGNDGKIVIGKCRDSENLWQMLRGGIKKNESPLQAAMRILQEETGIAEASFHKQAQKPVICEYPEGSNDLLGFRGQTTQWYLVDVFAQDFRPSAFQYFRSGGFRRGRPSLEFTELKRASPAEVLKLAHNNQEGDYISWQREVTYRAIFEEFGIDENNSAGISLSRPLFKTSSNPRMVRKDFGN
jgi:8-oxo-dGTP pyrophosphatase MutT (NUDIX family)